MADPYATLGVPRGADEAAIKKAYRKLAKELHPDKNKDNPKATERFSKVAQAYDLLSDKDKRARFDRGEIDGEGNPAAPFGFGGGGPGGPQGGFRASDFANDGGDFGDIFEGLFGGNQRRGGGAFGGFGRRPAAKGANVAYRLAVAFEDAARLSPQRITLRDGKTRCGQSPDAENKEVPAVHHDDVYTLKQRCSERSRLYASAPPGCLLGRGRARPGRLLSCARHELTEIHYGLSREWDHPLGRFGVTRYAAANRTVVS